MSATPVRVLIADDQVRTRASVRAALEEDGGFVVCAEAADASAAIDAALATEPDACLLDINMPGSGIAATTRIAAALPGTPIVILTVSRDDTDGLTRRAARPLLLKGSRRRADAPAPRRVLAGEACLPARLSLVPVESSAREYRRIGIAPSSRLTDWPARTSSLMRALRPTHRGTPLRLGDDGAFARRRSASRTSPISRGAPARRVSRARAESGESYTRVPMATCARNPRSLHPVETDTAWSESYFTNCYDPDADVGLHSGWACGPTKARRRRPAWLPGGCIDHNGHRREQTGDGRLGPRCRSGALRDDRN